MRRRLLSFVTFLSLLLCAAACVVWVRSRFVSDRVEWTSVRATPPVTFQWLNIRTTTGGVLVRWDRRIHDQVVFVNGGPPPFHWERSEPVPLSGLYPADSWIERAGFRVKHSHTYYGATAITNEMFSLAFPLWVVVAAGAAMPVTVMMRRRAVRRRARFGLCPRCGYDLRATPERCPECGVVPSL